MCDQKNRWHSDFVYFANGNRDLYSLKYDTVYIPVWLHNIKKKLIAFLNLNKLYKFKQSKNPM